MITLGQLSNSLDALKQSDKWNPHEEFRPDTTLASLLAVVGRDLEASPRLKERK